MVDGVIKRHAYTFDADLELRDVGDGAETSSADEAGIAFEPRSDEVYGVVVDITAIDAADGTETYAFVVDTDSLAAFTDSPVEVGRLTYPRSAGTGRIVIPIAGVTVEKLDSDAAAIRVGVELGGTTPSITYGAFLTRL